jgi:hypothetical protein
VDLMTNHHLLEPTGAFAELGLINLSETDFAGVLQKVSELAKRTLPGADAVSVTLVQDRGAHTAAFAGATSLWPSTSSSTSWAPGRA